MTAAIPPFGLWDIIESINLGNGRPLDESERMAFAGAPKEAMMVRIGEAKTGGAIEWEIIVSYDAYSGNLHAECFGAADPADPDGMLAFVWHAGKWERA